MKLITSFQHNRAKFYCMPESQATKQEGIFCNLTLLVVLSSWCNFFLHCLG